MCFGNAYLSIPNVFSKTGWLGGICLFLVIGLINIYTMIIQIKIAEKHPKLHSYSEIGGKIFGKRGKLAVDIPIWISQISVCCGYLYFIAEQMDSVVCHYTGGSKTPEGVITCDDADGCYCGKSNLYILMLTLPALPVSWIETYTVLSYFSTAGIFLAIAGMVCMFGILGDKVSQGEVVDTDLKTFDVLAFFGNIGVAIFVFEGNAVVINVHSEARHPDKFNKILASAISTICTLFMVFASFAYYVYRDETNPIFTLNFYPINGLITFILFCVCTNAFVSYPI